jgi:hypothetical protein
MVSGIMKSTKIESKLDMVIFRQFLSGRDYIRKYLLNDSVRQLMIVMIP